MKFTVLLILFVLSMSVFAEVTHVKTCSQLTSVCAIYHSDLEFTTKQEGRFQLFLESKDQSEVQLVKTDLWMQMGSHGHGSSPLKITPSSPGEFDITQAYFVMRGAWQIRVTYKQGNVQETLILPVLIKE